MAILIGKGTVAGNKAASQLGMQPQPPVDATKKAKRAGQRKAMMGSGLASR
jgi:hypothetical protein